MWEIQQINIYPVKGLAGISVDECLAQFEGFQNDRKWMIVDEDNLFVSQRKFSIMATIKTRLDGDSLILSHENDELIISLHAPEINEVFAVTIWQHTVDAYEWSTKASQWLTDILGQKVKFVARAPKAQRLKKIPSIDRSVPLSFADGYPYLVLGTESVNTLNEKLNEPINGNRFRANIIAKTEEAHLEDQWKSIETPDASLQVIKPCVRCQVITIDQETGIKGKEPNITLSKYRREGNGIIFGANTICNKEGLIKVGDRLKEING